MNKIPLNLQDVKPYAKSYDAFLGCDFTTEPLEISDQRSPDCLNMIADDAGYPQKRVGWRVLTSYDKRINGIHYADLTGLDAPVLIVHSGETLYAYDYTNHHSTQITTGANDAPSVSFAHGGYLYFMDGDHFLRIWYSSNAFHTEAVKDVAKIPTTGRGGHYEATVEKDENDDDVTVYTWTPCTAYEEPNLLSSSQINLIAADGVNKVFWLTEHGCTVTKVEKYVSTDWETVSSGYTITEDATEGKTKITFTTAPAAHPVGAGIDNLRITFTSTENPADASLIEKCNIVTRFGYFNDNRFFVSGNPDHKNRDWASAIDDPTYWEKNQWTDVGSDQTAIMGYLHYGDVLAVIKEDDNQDAEIYVRSAYVQSEGIVMFPCQQGVKGVGAISKRALVSLRDDPLFFAKEGVFAVAGTDASQQRTLQNRSFFVDTKLKQEPNKHTACAAVWGDRFLLAFPGTGHCYVADARLQTAFNSSYVYEWYYWENIPAAVFLEHDGEMYFGTNDGRLCKFNNDLKSSIKYNDELYMVENPEDPTLEVYLFKGGKGILSRWTTRVDAFGTATKYKTMTKRGCTAVFKSVSGGGFRIMVTTNKGERIIIEDNLENAFDFNNIDFSAIDFSDVSTLPALWDFANIDFNNIDFSSLRTPPVYPLNSKVKKFTLLQLTFENDKPSEDFGILGIQLQYTINNYIK